MGALYHQGHICLPLHLNRMDFIEYTLKRGSGDTPLVGVKGPVLAENGLSAFHYDIRLK